MPDGSFVSKPEVQDAVDTPKAIFSVDNTANIYIRPEGENLQSALYLLRHPFKPTCTENYLMVRTPERQEQVGSDTPSTRTAQHLCIFLTAPYTRHAGRTPTLPVVLSGASAYLRILADKQCECLGGRGLHTPHFIYFVDLLLRLVGFKGGKVGRRGGGQDGERGVRIESCLYRV